MAKTRLSRFAGASRPELALAFALDTVAAALASPVVSAVLVVTDDARVATQAWALGADRDRGRPTTRAQPRPRRTGSRVAAETTSAPAGRRAVGRPAGPAPGRPDRSAAAAAEPFPACFVADVEGTGTTLLAAADGVDLGPPFGHRSRARHAAAGAVELTACRWSRCAATSTPRSTCTTPSGWAWGRAPSPCWPPWAALRDEASLRPVQATVRDLRPGQPRRHRPHRRRGRAAVRRSRVRRGRAAPGAGRPAGQDPARRQRSARRDAHPGHPAGPDCAGPAMTG